MCFEPYKNANLKYIPIGDALLASQYGLSIEMNEEGNGTKIYRMNEITNMMCDRNLAKYAPIGSKEIEIYKLNDRDVLFNRTNSQAFVGRTGIFKKFSDEDFVFASYLIRIIPNPEIVTPEYLTAFLNTKYGVLDVKRRSRVSINQSNVNAEELKLIEIPLIGQQIQSLITTAFDNAFNLIQASETTYSRAESLLLSSLGLAGWLPEDRLWFVRDYAEVREAERFDADYFQPKYDEIINAVKACPGGWDALGNLANLKARNYQPEAGREYKYIELADIGANGEITGCTAEKGRDLPTRARRQVSAGDVIVSSIEGSLESVALIHDEYDKALCSTGFHVVRSEAINPETLLVLLKSAAGQMQIEKGCRGTILTAIGKDELAKIVLPILPQETQGEIRRMAVESFRLRAESGRLLECAKRAVEIAIEENEEAAREWLTKETGETA